MDTALDLPEGLDDFGLAGSRLIGAVVADMLTMTAFFFLGAFAGTAFFATSLPVETWPLWALADLKAAVDLSVRLAGDLPANALGFFEGFFTEILATETPLSFRSDLAKFCSTVCAFRAISRKSLPAPSPEHSKYSGHRHLCQFHLARF